MAQTSTIRLALSSILGTVQTTAATATNLIGAANDGVGMLNKFVSDAAHQQRIDSTVEMHSYKAKAVERMAKETTERAVDIKSFCSTSDFHKDTFVAAHSEYSELLKDL